MQIYPDTVWAWVWASLLKIYIFHMEIEIHCLQSLSRLVFILWANVEFANNTTLNAIAYRRARAPTTSNSSSTSSNRGGSNIKYLEKWHWFLFSGNPNSVENEIFFIRCKTKYKWICENIRDSYYLCMQERHANTRSYQWRQ